MIDIRSFFERESIRPDSTLFYYDEVVKRWFFAGAEWFSWPMPDTKKPNKDLLKSEIETHGSFVCEYAPNNLGVYQLGFSHLTTKTLATRLGAKKSTICSLAVYVSSLMDGPWMGLFHIGAAGEDKYWFLAVGEQGFILPNGDKIGTYDSLQPVFSEMKTYGAWNSALLGKENTLASLLERVHQREQDQIDAKNQDFLTKRYHCAFRDIRLSASTAIMAFLVFLVVLIGSVALAVSWVEHWAKRHNGIQNAITDIVPINLSWQTQPMPVDFIRTCYGQARHLPLESSQAPGWNLSSVTCQKSGDFLVEYKRGQGALMSHRPDGVLSPDWSSVLQKRKMNLSAQSRDDAPNTTFGTVEASQVTDFINLNHDKSSVFYPKKLSVPGGTDYEFTMNLMLSPNVYLDYFRSLQGARIKEMKWTRDKGWEMQFDLYTH